MRGILAYSLITRNSERISPAHAGNTIVFHGQLSLSEDQPRTCGEYGEALDCTDEGEGSAPHMRGILNVMGPVLMWSGSAPHMRGILTGRSAMSVAVGISPAHAGNTLGWLYCRDSEVDQPRTCGEYARA